MDQAWFITEVFTKYNISGLRSNHVFGDKHMMWIVGIVNRGF